MAEEATTTAAEMATNVLHEEMATIETGTRNKPFFETEVSEAELRGEETPPEDKAKETDSKTAKADDKPAKADDKKEADPEDKASDKKDDKKADDADEADPDAKKSDKPPKGFVPNQALKEEREKRKQLQSELEYLRTQIEKQKSDPAVPPGDAERQEFLKSIGVPTDFTVLTEQQEDALMEEDLFAYQKYQRNLRKYERGAYDLESRQQTSTEISKRAEAIVTGAVRRMESAVPGIHDPDQEVNKALTEFAVTNGFEKEYLNAMTDPMTMILPAGSKTPIYLGDGAASLVEFIHAVSKAKAGSDPEAERAKMEEEITKKVTAELMKKFKAAGSSNFKSLGDAPGSMEAVKGGTVTEADFSKLSAAEQRAALGG